MASRPHQPDQPPMASPIDLDEYEMPDIDHSDKSDDAYSITMTTVSGVSGSEYGSDDKKEPLLSNNSLPDDSLPTATPALVSETHADRPSDTREGSRDSARPRRRSSVLELFLLILQGLTCLLGLWWASHTTPDTSSCLCANTTQINATQINTTQMNTAPIPYCGPTKPYQPYHLLPTYNQTPYGILDCNHDATHDELLQSFFDKSTAASLVHFYIGIAGTPREMDCRPWKRPVYQDIQVLREGSGSSKLTPEQWAIQWFLLEEDRPITDSMILPYLGIFFPDSPVCLNDGTSVSQRFDRYWAQMERVGGEGARKMQLEIKELEDKKKSEEE
ncbi:hypothetical protein QBC45DRAFT_472991 [Copromyces sp. CBS 386.78]|nr:hypothetical protein QBC45DRAFT_472991 [Copromyces sp. CBS 386.78]